MSGMKRWLLPLLAVLGAIADRSSSRVRMLMMVTVLGWTRARASGGTIAQTSGG